MRNILTICAAVLLAVVLAAPAYGAAAREEMIVSTAWLAEHLQDAGLVILQVDREEEYKAGHIPGAQHVTLNTVGLNVPNGAVLELRPLEELTEWVRGAGIRANSRIVICAGKTGSPTSAARVYWTLDYLGLGDRAALLDGGVRAWAAEGRPLSTESPTAKAGDYAPAVHPEVLVAVQWVQENLKSPNATILDARTPDFYTGTNNAGGRYQPSGHLPGAVNVPFRDVVEGDSTKFKTRDQLREMFGAAGVKPGGRVVTYCHIGQQASLVYFVAKFLGYEAAMYDGSFTEWAGMKLPVEQGEPAQRPEQRRDPRHDNESYDVAAMFKMHLNLVSKDFTTGAQPTPGILREFRDKGFKAVINLRPPREHNAAEEEAAAKELGLRYFNIPVDYRDPTFEQVDEFLKLTDDAANRPALIHCTMNIRAGAFFAIRRVLRDGWSFEEAEKEAAKGAEIAPHLKRFALAYIAARQK